MEASPAGSAGTAGRRSRIFFGGATPRAVRACRAHVLLCWLALLLVRIIETRTGATWATVREDLQDLHVGVFTGPAGTFTQTSTPTPAARAALTALDVDPPKKILHLAPADPQAAEQQTG